jgi:hypothetical protein
MFIAVGDQDHEKNIDLDYDNSNFGCASHCRCLKTLLFVGLGQRSSLDTCSHSISRRDRDRRDISVRIVRGLHERRLLVFDRRFMLRRQLPDHGIPNACSRQTLESEISRHELVDHSDGLRNCVRSDDCRQYGSNRRLASAPSHGT